MLELTLAFLVFGLLGLVMVFLNRLLGPRRTNPTKETPFECGSPYLQKDIPPVPLPYALVALVFLLFDIEVAFFFPWALVVRTLGGPALIALAGYLAVLAAGFVYAWKKGFLEWE
jgi:NADH-quinone oxidoreductase subunit A